MKPESMKVPALQEIYNYRHQYQQHKKKLMKIYEDRTSHLGYDNTRVSQFDQIKQSKIKNFIHKFNQKSDSIAKQNLQLLSKIENTKTSLNRSLTQQQLRKSRTFANPDIKKKIKQTEAQNTRISIRMKNISSSLNQKKFIRDFSKSQQIKSRIMKYAVGNDSRVLLKSERYLQSDGEGSQVSLAKLKAYKQKLLNCSEPRNPQIKSSFRKSAISHYRKDDIFKNRVDTSTSSLAAIKLKVFRRSVTSTDQKGNSLKQSNFFTTQPNKQRKIGRKKIYLA